ncbi:MAG: hypothetical protein J5846_09585 [Desulfovibrio sp.]|nr:hypothetical protein [Desulfovibrio sp.]
MECQQDHDEEPDLTERRAATAGYYVDPGRWRTLSCNYLGLRRHSRKSCLTTPEHSALGQ